MNARRTSSAMHLSRIWSLRRDPEYPDDRAQRFVAESGSQAGKILCLHEFSVICPCLSCCYLYVVCNLVLWLTGVILIYYQPFFD